MTFQFPSIHSFPPFFTRQPNQETFTSQKQQWQALIMAYCRYNKLYKLPITQETLASPLFRNEDIKRQVKIELLREIVVDLVSQKNAEYTSKKKDDVLIYWRSLDEWATLMSSYVNETAQTNTILTMYDITEEGSLGADFKGMDSLMLRRIIDVLIKRNKAAILSSNGEEQGVKFF